MNVRVGNHIAPREAPISSADFSASSAKRMTSPVVPGVSTSPSKRFIPTWTATDLPEGLSGPGKMQGLGHDPFTLPFLHRFYYQTLDANERRASKGPG
jgi:hypothetical protein